MMHGQKNIIIFLIFASQILKSLKDRSLRSHSLLDNSQFCCFFFCGQQPKSGLGHIVLRSLDLTQLGTHTL